MNYYELPPDPGDETRERQRLVQAVRGAVVGVRSRQVANVLADPVGVGAYFGMPSPERLAALQEPIKALVGNAKRYADEVARLAAATLGFSREQDEVTKMWNRFHMAIGAVAVPNSYEEPGDPRSSSDNYLLRTCSDGSRLAVSSLVQAEMHPDSSTVSSQFSISRHPQKGTRWERVGATIFEVSGIESLTRVSAALPEELEAVAEVYDEEAGGVIRPGDMPSAIHFPGLVLGYNNEIDPDWSVASAVATVTEASDQFALGVSRLSKQG